ncbi:hypothetical protein [Dapis sp. BLCC M172]|uniref:hypothetical protein n=1 Tax=Dapis sp. BLCC M172 TaxID=2975281 RepID=UPI003CF53EA2
MTRVVFFFADSDVLFTSFTGRFGGAIAVSISDILAVALTASTELYTGSEIDPLLLIIS